MKVSAVRGCEARPEPAGLLIVPFAKARKRCDLAEPVTTVTYTQLAPQKIVCGGWSKSTERSAFAEHGGFRQQEVQ